MMRIIGFRCSNNDYTFAVLEGTKISPVIVAINTISFPKNYTRPAILQWFYLDLQGLLNRYKPNAIFIKKAEGIAARGKTFVERVGNEAIILLVAGINNIKYVEDRVKSTIARNLGYKGKAHYLKDAFKNSVLEEYENEPEKIKEAILVAWSALK